MSVSIIVNEETVEEIKEAGIMPEAVRRLFKEEFEAERNAGRMEGRDQVLFSLVDDGLLSPGVAAAKANMSEAEFRARMERDRQDRQKGQ